MTKQLPISVEKLIQFTKNSNNTLVPAGHLDAFFDALKTDPEPNAIVAEAKLIAAVLGEIWCEPVGYNYFYDRYTKGLALGGAEAAGVITTTLSSYDPLFRDSISCAIGGLQEEEGYLQIIWYSKTEITGMFLGVAEGIGAFVEEANGGWVYKT